MDCDETRDDERLRSSGFLSNEAIMIRGVTGQMGSVRIGSSKPEITSSAAPSIVEGNTAVLTVTATRGQTPYTFSISGTDSALFSINSSTGALAFLVAPDYAAPGDAGANNVYNLTVRVASVGGAYAEQAVAVTVTETYLFQIRSDTEVFQGTDESTPAAVNDLVRRANDQGTLGINAVAPSDAARPTRVADGFRFSSGDYFEIGTSASLQPSTLRVSFTLTRTATLAGLDGIIVWAKPNANAGGNGWYLQLDGPNGRMTLNCDSGQDQWNMTLNTAFPLNTPVAVFVTFDPGASPTSVLKLDGATQTRNFSSATAITSTSDPKYIGFNSPGYGGGYLVGCDIENLIIDNVVG